MSLCKYATALFSCGLKGQCNHLKSKQNIMKQ